MPLANDTNGNAVHGADAWGVVQSVAIGASSAQSAAFAAGTKYVLLSASVLCHVTKPAANPTATTAGVPLAPGQTLRVSVQGGQKIAVIQSAAGGFLGVVECS